MVRIQDLTGKLTDKKTKYLQKHVLLMLFLVSLQIEQDYNKLFDGKGDLLFTKWPVVSSCILDYGNRISPGWKVKFGVQEKRDEDFTSKVCNY